MTKFTKEQLIEELKSSTQNASGMFEISEDTICNLMSMLTYAAPQLPQSSVVSDEMIDTFEAEFRRAFEVSAGVEQLIELGYQGEKFSLSIRDAATWWKLGRAAMLQGGNHAEQHLEMVGHSGDANENGSSPVIPDDVRRMDWLVSKTVDVREPMVYGSHSIFWSQTTTDEEDDYHATKLREQIDAAMAVENAAAPQQEVKK